MKLRKIFFSLSLIFIFFTTTTKTKNPYKADFIIFSYNRPLQLYALLESISTYMTGIGDIRILYRSDSASYDAAYKEVKDIFNKSKFIKQGRNPRRDFKRLTMQCLKKSPHKFIIFAVDDIIVKDFVDLEHATKMLEETNSYGFYLRLGNHITFNYPRNKPESLPKNLIIIEDNVLTWKFNDGGNTWQYPNTVDMTIYNKKEIIKAFSKMNFSNPNSLEGGWSCRVGNIRTKNGLCYETSKIVNLPLNRVQNTYKNRHMGLITANELLDIFNQGLKIDISTLFKIENISAHMNYNPTFINR